MRFTACAAVVLAIAAQQAPQPVIRSRVTLVPIDVRVVDKDGRPITDLEPEDFTITEDGIAQTVAHFQTHALTPDPAAADAPLGLASERKGAESLGQHRRVFLIVVSRGRHQAFKHGDALARFIGTSLMPQDVVAIAGWNRATDFTTDHARLKEVAERFAARHERVEFLLLEWYQGLRGRQPNRGRIPPHVQREIDWIFEPAALAAPIKVPGGHPGFAEFMRRSLPPDRTFDLARLLAGLNYLRFIDGEKRLVWLTEFAGSLPRPVSGGGIPAMAAANRIAMDIIQTGGTIGAPAPFYIGQGERRRLVMPNTPSSGALTLFMWSLQNARDTAAATGGVASTLRRGHEAFAALSAVTSAGYSLGYYPTNAALDGRFRAIAIEVKRPGARVLARSGYYAIERAEPLDLREYITAERLREATGARRPFDEIPISVVTLTSTASNQLEAEIRIGLSDVAGREEDGLRIASLELAALATDDRRRPAGDVRQRLDVRLTPERWNEAVEQGLVMTLRLQLSRPARDLKVVAYDYASDRLGTVAVTVPGR